MNQELRDVVGRAIYEEEAKRLEALDIGTALSWDEVLEDTREHYRLCGEKAVSAFLEYVKQDYGSARRKE